VGGETNIQLTTSLLGKKIQDELERKEREAERG
jgi:hypothetical protein